MPSGSYFLNPRRLPRVPARCRVEVLAVSGRWRAETVDIGPGGCQLVSPRVLAAGSQVGLLVADGAGPGSLEVAGRVVWLSALAPPRLGVAFVAAGSKAARWFDALVTAQPALARAASRVPDKIPVDARIHLAQPPRNVVDFTPAELLVLSHLADGPTAGQLRERLAPGWRASLTVLFGLLARQLVTLSASEGAPASRWRAILLDAEIAERVGALPRGDRMPELAVVPHASGMDRPTGAQHHVERALADFRSGRVPDAIAHLRIASSIAPRDAFISRILDRLSPRV